MGVTDQTSLEGAAGDERCCVLLAEQARLVDLAAASGALLPLHPELSPIDVRTRVRYAAGIPLEDAPRAHAEACAAALEAAGVPALVVLQRDMPQLEAPTRVGRLTLTPDGIEGLAAAVFPGGRAGDPVAMAWDDVELCLGFALERPLERRSVPHLKADEAAARRVLEETPLGPDAERLQYTLARLRTREGRDALLAIDLIGGGRTLRLERGGTTWSESHSQHSLEAFVYLGRRLLAALEGRGARIARETTHLLDGLLDTALFSYEEEVRRYERWLIARAAACP